MHDPVECFLLYLCPFFCSPKVWLLQTDWKTDWQREDAEYSSVIPHAALALFIFCISKPACLQTTVVNISRRIMPLCCMCTPLWVVLASLMSVHCKFLTVLHCKMWSYVSTCHEDGACIHSNILSLCLYTVSSYGHTIIVAYVCVWYVVTLHVREMLTFSTHCWCSKQNLCYHWSQTLPAVSLFCDFP